MKPIEPHYQYHENGNIFRKHYMYNNAGRCHCLDGPAFVEYYNDNLIKEEKYYVKGKLHRVDEPPHIMYFYSSETNKKFIEYCYHYKNYKYHRLDGPALYERFRYFVDGERQYKDERYFILEKEYTKEMFFRKVRKIKFKFLKKE